MVQESAPARHLDLSSSFLSGPCITSSSFLSWLSSTGGEGEGVDGGEPDTDSTILDGLEMSTSSFSLFWLRSSGGKGEVDNAWMERSKGWVLRINWSGILDRIGWSETDLL